MTFSRRAIVRILVASLAAIFLFLGGYLALTLQSQKQPQASSQVFEQDTLTIAGEILAVNAKENSFLLQELTTRITFKVLVGEHTKLTQLVVPTGVKEGASFTFAQKDIALQDFEVGRQAFVSSSHPIERGKDILSPTEVRLLPQ